MESLNGLPFLLGTNTNNAGRISEAQTPEDSVNQYNLSPNLYNILKQKKKTTKTNSQEHLQRSL